MVDKANHEFPDTRWQIYNRGDALLGETSMDNFGMCEEIEKHPELNIDDFEFWHG